MTRSVNAPHKGEREMHDELEIRNGHPADTEVLPHTTGKRVPVQSTPLTRERVVTEIVRAIRAINTSFPMHKLNGETNLALDLGLESASRVDLLLEVERTLDVALDVGVVTVFAELTIDQLADLIVTLPDGQCGPIADDLA